VACGITVRRRAPSPSAADLSDWLSSRALLHISQQRFPIVASGREETLFGVAGGGFNRSSQDMTSILTS
jgi:hypothetical protein